MKILVTGASGFVGGRVVERLLQNAITVICIGRSKPKETLFPLHQVKFITGDMTDCAFLESAANVDAIIHCAGKAGDWGSYEEFYEANVVLTKNLLLAARKAHVKRFINISSPSIYFDFKDQLNMKEGVLPAHFSNAYAQTKYEAELLVQETHSKELETVSLRPRLVIGAGDTNVLPRLIRLQKNRCLFQIGDGKNIVDITSISNLVDAILLCLKAPSEAMGETYNISNGVPVRFWEFVDEVFQRMGIPTKKKYAPRALMMALARASEWFALLLNKKSPPKLLPLAVAVLSQSMTLDIEKAKTKLGYVPLQTHIDAIEEFVAWNTRQR